MCFFPHRVWICVQQLCFLLLCNVLAMLHPPSTVQSTRVLCSDEEMFRIHGKWPLTLLGMALNLLMHWGQRAALLIADIIRKLEVLFKIL